MVSDNNFDYGNYLYSPEEFESILIYRNEMLQKSKENELPEVVQPYDSDND